MLPRVFSLSAGIVVLAAACVGLPQPRPDVDAALARLRPAQLSGDAPIASELVRRAWERSGEDEGHEIALLHVGSDALAARAHLLLAARESVDIQVFAWEPDEAGAFLLELVSEAARRGVRVRLLVDMMANAGRASLADACVLHENLELRVYNPVGRDSAISRRDLMREGTVSMFRVNQRMHNKVMVVDGRVAVVGGRNVAESYFDMDPEFCYLDRDALVVGPAVDAAQRSFDRYWEWSRTIDAAYLDDVARELLAWNEAGAAPGWDPPALARYDRVRAQAGREAAAEVLPHSRFHRVERVDFVADPPGKRADGGEVDAAHAEEPREEAARDYVIIQSNYLVLTRKRIDGLASFLDEQPDAVVSYVTNSLAATANTLVYGVSRKQRTRLLDVGLHVYEMRPVPGDVRHFLPRYDDLVAEARARDGDAGGPRLAIHAKSVVIDGEIAIVSSHNLDPRSDELNTESGIVVWDHGVAAELEGELRLLMADPNSWRSASRPRIPVLSSVNDLFTSISRALPVLDVWPVRDYTNYELRDGLDAGASGEGAFHDRYEAVGEFPEVESAWKRWRTRFSSWFGGLIKGLL